MTYLELVRDTLSDSGAADEGAYLETLQPADAGMGLTDYQLRAARYVNDAWRKVQVSQKSWPWMREEFSALLDSGAAEKLSYTAADLVPGSPSPVWQWWTEGAGWFLSEEPTGAGTLLLRSPFPEISYDDYRRSYGGRTLARSRPVLFCVTPRREVRIAPAPGPGRRITVEGEYVRQPHVMLADGDEPLGLDQAYHEIVKWRAVMLMLRYDAAGDEYQSAKEQYTTLYSDLLISEGSQFEDPGTLA